jgi:hypothetical protein
MSDKERALRNLNPHKPARAAMWLWGKEYSQQGGGSMDFWDGLPEGRGARRAHGGMAAEVRLAAKQSVGQPSRNPGVVFEDINVRPGTHRQVLVAQRPIGRNEQPIRI